MAADQPTGNPAPGERDIRELAGGDPAYEAALQLERNRLPPPDPEEAEAAAPALEDPAEAAPEAPAEEPSDSADAEPAEEPEAVGEEPEGDAIYELVSTDRFELDGQVLTGEEIRRGFLREQDYTRKTQAVAEERKQLDAERQQSMGRVDALVQALEQTIQAYQPSPQAMEQLRQEDPGQWAALQQEQLLRQRQLEVARAEQGRLQQEQLATQWPREWHALLASDIDAEFKANPQDEYRKLSEWMISPTGGGLRPEEWQGTIDHRLIRLARDAYRARQLHDPTARNGAPQTAKRLARKPRRIRPGTLAEPAAPGDTEKREYAAAVENLKKDGGLDALAQAFLKKEQLKRQR